VPGKKARDSLESRAIQRLPAAGNGNSIPRNVLRKYLCVCVGNRRIGFKYTPSVIARHCVFEMSWRSRIFLDCFVEDSSQRRRDWRRALFLKFLLAKIEYLKLVRRILGKNQTEAHHGNGVGEKMKFKMLTSLSAILNIEGGVAALDQFFRFGARVWRTRATEFELPGTSRTFVPITMDGKEVQFRDEEAMLQIWSEPCEPLCGSQLLSGERLLPGDEYCLAPDGARLTGDDAQNFATWSGRFLLRWGNMNGDMEVAVDLNMDVVAVTYDGQRGTLVGYEFAGGSPVLMPLARILRRLYDERKAALVQYGTSEGSKDWSPFEIEADRRPLWQSAYGGMPSVLWAQARQLVDEEYRDCPELLAKDGDRLAHGMRAHILWEGKWESVWDGLPLAKYGEEVRWAFSPEAIAAGHYLAVDTKTEEAHLGPMNG